MSQVYVLKYIPQTPVDLYYDGSCGDTPFTTEIEHATPFFSKEEVTQVLKCHLDETQWERVALKETVRHER